ncbi:hypothetical protein [Actinomadura sp. SCN-SB]|uniref:hypothetical protein n=1 Tax=Actinomadura sp. SCN-SB TaxID=3373092 RepID=UPI003752831F
MSGGDIEARVAAISAEGERTLVLHGPEPSGRTAARMLPALPGVCFAESADPARALRQAVEHGLGRLILFATADDLVAALGLGADGLLGEITIDMGGTPELAAEVAAAGSARRACALWRDAGLLGPCGRELCRRVAAELESAAAGAGDDPIAAQVVLLDDAGERMIGMYGRLRR